MKDNRPKKKICTFCKKEFTSKDKKVKMCSKACRRGMQDLRYKIYYNIYKKEEEIKELRWKLKQLSTGQ